MRRLEVAALVVVAMVMAACSGSTATNSETSDPVTADPVTVDSGATDAADPQAVGSTTTSGESGGTAVESVDFNTGGDGLGDRLYPTLGNGGYDVQRYRFDLTFDTEGNVDAVAVIDLIVTAEIGSLNLDLADLVVSQVGVDGSDVEFRHVDRELLVTLGRVVARGEAIEVRVAYHGLPTPLPADAVPFGPGWVTGRDVAYLFSQPDGAQSLFPVNDHPSDRADVELTVHTPSGVEAISGGALVSESSEGDRDTVVWEMTNIAPYLIPLAVGQLTLVSDRIVDGVRYDVWVSDQMVESAALDAFDAQPDMISFFADRFGPYPFDRAGALIVDDSLGAALETQTIPTYTSRSVEWGEVVIAHELAHQWFGDAIALGQWDDIWLNEGFATFAHWLWIEKRFGTDAYAREVREAYAIFSGTDLVENGVDPAVAARRVRDAFPPPDDPRASDLFNASVYERAGLGIVAIRDLVGDQALFGFIREYSRRFSGSVTSTEQFIDLMSEELGPDAAELMRAWVSAPIVPALPVRGLAPVGG